MKMLFALIPLIIGLTSCAVTNLPNSKNDHASSNVHTTYWVNSTKKPCVSVAPTECLQVQKSEYMVPGNWLNLYSDIKGFAFEPGYIYKLAVNEEALAKEQLPADASSITYTLIDVLDKQRDPIFRLHDIWSLTYIDGTQTSMTGYKNRPQLEIYIKKMQVIGNDGCNNFMGSLKQLEANSIEFGPLASTRKMCADMSLSDEFHRHMAKIKSYQLKELTLSLFDANQGLLLEFRKVD